MRVRIDIVAYKVENASVEVIFKDNKDFRRFAKKVQRKLKRNEYITIGGINEAYTLKTSDIVNVHYEIIEREESKHENKI